MCLQYVKAKLFFTYLYSSALTATHRGSGIIVLMAKTRMNMGTVQSPGLVGAEM